MSRFLFMGERGWGAGGKSIMRLQMPATDPDFLEKRLGERAALPAWARRP